MSLWSLSHTLDLEDIYAQLQPLMLLTDAWSAVATSLWRALKLLHHMAYPNLDIVPVMVPGPEPGPETALHRARRNVV